MVTAIYYQKQRENFKAAHAQQKKKQIEVQERM